MTDDEKKAFGWLLGVPALLIVGPVTSVMYGWTLATLWAWFIVPLFGLSQLSLLNAIGLIFVVHIFTLKRTSSTKEEKEKTLLHTVLDGLIFVTVVCGMTLLEGWIVMKLMAR